ncbi:MAG: hypothetical protein SGARI_004275, partial [Bacillariaceae sp.]
MSRAQFQLCRDVLQVLLLISGVITASELFMATIELQNSGLRSADVALGSTSILAPLVTQQRRVEEVDFDIEHLSAEPGCCNTTSIQEALHF